MNISPAAIAKLKKLLDRLPSATGGLRFEGYIGTCHGSSPILKPVATPDAGDVERVEDGIRFFVPADKVDLFAAATLDVDRSFMGRGLFLTWPHGQGCDCSKRCLEK